MKDGTVFQIRLETVREPIFVRRVLPVPVVAMNMVWTLHVNVLTSSKCSEEPRLQV